ncbi:hypothetical protein A2300_02810 [Candidatus Falkowbacteria bacterium RIFOXYB2_FULL_35_7]|uniref:Uncharacterized protein n=1 Tax=Candidatus Falkowbacteria bacterium RIFOXYC2_FULL_36_12 TaxID=1798002 RepID=A0A1F5SYC7_9BACT|nr:MAG: hypothetical protein A2300_02810 [Candidatus Falkowbacteria bacterium RIFOXYB2_FULL_35_7]OGF31725.1 MAG: hypothetical protein A2478_04540 [Candidatus Falkowbacteria bacterium RIFOXYC2_FULL_36_12]
MEKKCEKCGAPIGGFLSGFSKILGVKRSEKNPNICNKCDAEPVQAEENEVPAPMVDQTPEVNLMPDTEEEKKDSISTSTEQNSPTVELPVEEPKNEMNDENKPQV